jgi:hypothetical protein
MPLDAVPLYQICVNHRTLFDKTFPKADSFVLGFIFPGKMTLLSTGVDDFMLKFSRSLHLFHRFGKLFHTAMVHSAKSLLVRAISYR